jgi:hypothetical protein
LVPPGAVVVIGLSWSTGGSELVVPEAAGRARCGQRCGGAVLRGAPGFSGACSQSEPMYQLVTYQMVR